MYVWMYGCMDVCMYVCMYAACMYACMHVCMHACMYGCMYGCMDAWMHGCMDACMHACMDVCMHVCMYACMHVCMYACMHVCMYARLHVCMCACMHVCMDACMHVWMYVWMYGCMYACMHACMHACIVYSNPPRCRKAFPGYLRSMMLLHSKSTVLGSSQFGLLHWATIQVSDSHRLSLRSAPLIKKPLFINPGLTISGLSGLSPTLTSSSCQVAPVRSGCLGVQQLNEALQIGHHCLHHLRSAAPNLWESWSYIAIKTEHQ